MFATWLARPRPRGGYLYLIVVLMNGVERRGSEAKADVERPAFGCTELA